MGVTGLWRLVEPAGKPVPLETLENKVLAVDISIWLHQMVKGYQDPRGGAVANAHLLGLFQRLCKLLYYRIKPIFVFDGGVPFIKKQTIINRQIKKSQMHNNVDRVRRQLMEILLKQTAVKTVLATSPDKKIPTKKSPLKSSNEAYDEQLFKLPDMVNNEDAELEESSSESDSERVSTKHQIDLHSIDVKSEYFKSLTPREKHDLLTELKETRKQNSWGRLHELPAQSDDFSNYQMNRLLKRRQVQVSLEEAEKEIGGHFLSINELEVLLNEEGISTKIEQLPTRRIASDDSTRFILIKDVKEAIEAATKREASTKSNIDENNTVLPSTSQVDKPLDVKEKLGGEFDDDLKAAIQLSLNTSTVDDGASSSKETDNVDYLTHFGDDFIYDTDSDCSIEDQTDDETKNLRNSELALAKAYMLENSGLSEYEIMRIIDTQKAERKKSLKLKRVFRIAEDLPQASKTKFIQDAEIITIDEECELSDQTKHPSNSSIHISSKELVDNKDTLKTISPTIIFPTGEVSNSTNGTISSSIIETIKEESLDAISNASISDSDDSFEEVPESTSKDVSHKQPLLQLVIAPDIVLEDDIFADVFQAASGEKTYNPKSKIAINQKSTHVPEINHKKIETALPLSNVEIIVQKKSDLFNETTKISTPLRNKNINSLEKNKTESVANIDNLPPKPPVQKNISVNSSNACTSQKDMPLKEIVQIATQEEALINLEENYSQSKSDTQIPSQRISAEELSILANDLEMRGNELEKEHNKLDRMGRDISQEMTKDAKDLLQMFGIPYIVAPMEAEAQCAFLETIKLTDGTITDDSDIWLFGGKTVYKNFFNQQKYVLQFLSENIQQCFRLPREQLILFALLVGSDYTNGITGVGPVTALEILAAFPPMKAELVPPYVTLLAGLKKFRSWYSSSRTMGNTSLRNKLKNISLSEEFPSHRVVEAYLSPEVETSSEKFSWGKLDITAIREFSREKFGWSQTKTDTVLLPVLKRLDEKISQQSIRAFFRTDVKQADASDKMSKRVKNAIEKMGNCTTEDLIDEEGPSAPKKPKKANEQKRKRMPKKKTEQIEPNPTCTIESQEAIQIPQVSTINNTQTDQNIESRKFSYPERHTERFPQREKDKSKIMQNKLKAIELFRTSRGGPGFVKKRKKTAIAIKEDAELSENSD